MYPRMHHHAVAAPTFGVRKGSWTKEEDTLLRRCIAVYGEGNWHQVPKRAGLNRCRKSCRLRWLNYLRPNIKRGRFSTDEVDFMVRLHKLLGNRWALIAGRLPGRTTNDVKNYWNSHFPKKRSLEPKKSISTTAHATIRAMETTFASTTEIIKPRSRTFKKTSPRVHRSNSEAMPLHNEQNCTAPEQQQLLSTLFPENDSSSGPNTIRLASLLELEELMEKIDDDSHIPDSRSLSWSRSVSGPATDRASEGGSILLGQTTGDVMNYRNANQLYTKNSPGENMSLNTTAAYTTRRAASATFAAATTEIIKPRPRTFSKTSPWLQKRDSNTVFTYDVGQQNNTPLEHQQQQSRELFHAQENSTSDNIAWWESLLQLEEVTEKIDRNGLGPNSEYAGSRSESMSGLSTNSSREHECMAQPNTIIQEEEEGAIGERNDWEDFCLDVQFWEAMSGP